MPLSLASDALRSWFLIPYSSFLTPRSSLLALRSSPQVSPGQRRLHDIGSVHAPLGPARTHDIVQLINEENHLRMRLRFLDDVREPLAEHWGDDRASLAGWTTAANRKSAIVSQR